MLYALLGAVAIGLVLGLLGSGGSILTVPVLVYLAGRPDKVAIAESLAIVGAIAAVGAATYARQGLVDGRAVLGFGVPGIVGTFLGAVAAAYVPGAVQLALFGVVMLAAAGAMFKGRAALAGEARPPRPAWVIAALGVSVGVMTGLVGVGGGFLIVPALVLLVGLDMRLAVGTSLSIIVLNSATGFLKYLDTLTEAGAAVDWRLIGVFAAIGIAGSFVGNALSQRVPQAQLKKGFAVFLVVMGTFILIREGPRALAPRAAEAAPLAATLPASGTPRAGADTTDVPRLTPAETADYLRDHPGAQVLDVRRPAEVAVSGTLVGAVRIDLGAPGFERSARALLDPARPVVVYCRSGARAERAAQALAALGFADLVNAGGFQALAEAGLPTD